MNAQEKWKQEYADAKTSTSVELKWRLLDKAQRHLYAAALERKLASAQRIIEAHTMRINGVIRVINDGAEQWEHVFDEETGSCKYCGYEWPCQYETIRRALLGLDDEDIIACQVPYDRIEIAA